MAIVTLRWTTALMWSCGVCGAQFPCEGPKEDPNGTRAAVEHGEECGSSMNAATAPPWIVCILEPPCGREA